MFQVAPDLMSPSRHWRQFEQGVAAAWIAIDFDREFYGGEAAEMGQGFLGRLAAGFAMEFVVVALAAQRVIDAALFRWMSADYRQVTFFNLPAFELLPEQACALRVETEEQDARGAAIQAVGRPDPLADLVTQDLDRETRLVPVDLRAVDKQIGRFVDHDDVFVAIEDGELFSQRNAAGQFPESACR